MTERWFSAGVTRRSANSAASPLRPNIEPQTDR